LLRKLSNLLKKNSSKQKNENHSEQNYHSIEFANPPEVVYKIDNIENITPQPSTNQPIIKKRKRKIPIFKIFIILSTILMLGLFGFLVDLYLNVKDDVHKIVEQKMDVSSEIFDRNGRKIANIVSNEYRLYVKFNDIPARVIETLLATEDTTYFEHGGINPEAIVRAIFKDIIAMKKVEGASTITQQFVRNTILTKEKRFIRKIKEIFLAIELHDVMSKDIILERYLNKIYFGNGYYGIRTASKGYFHKELNRLSLKETAMLIGLIKAPSFYNPNRHKDHCIARANRVLKRMYEDLGWINETEYTQAIEYKPKVYNTDKTENKAPYVTDYILKQLKYIKDLRKGGYQIYTTIDLDFQDLARKSLKNGYDEVVKRMKNKYDYSPEQIKEFNGAMLVLNPHTGEVLAMVGGVDYKKSQFNRVTQGKRQIGSNIKPFFYQIALNMGYSGATILFDIQKTFSYQNEEGEEQKWKPQNYSHNVKGLIPMREALYRSRNLATIDLVDKLGFRHFYKVLKKYGFKDLKNNLSSALGSYSTTMWKLAGHYTIISNYGKKVEPFIIEKVVRNNLSEDLPEEIVFQVDDLEDRTTELNVPQQAYLMIDIMKDVICKGTGRRARFLTKDRRGRICRGLELAGKTGTTDDGKDVWFTVFSPDYQVHVWYGNDNNTPIFNSQDEKVSSSRLAVPTGAKFFEEIKKIVLLNEKFEIPKGVKCREYNGVRECFTDISKPPKKQQNIIEDSLIF
jgi:penicillin-binding protein 1A